jgi:CBS domain-containing protein
MSRDTPVADVMTATVVTVQPEMAVTDAAKLLGEKNIGAAPVVDSAGRLVGMLFDDDLIVQDARIHFPTVISVLDAYLVLPGQLSRFEHELKKAVGATVADVMDDEYQRIGPRDTLEQAATVMHEKHVTHLPVVDGDQLVGILARGDLVRALAR